MLDISHWHVFVGNFEGIQSFLDILKDNLGVCNNNMLECVLKYKYSKLITVMKESVGVGGLERE